MEQQIQCVAEQLLAAPGPRHDFLDAMLRHYAKCVPGPRQPVIGMVARAIVAAKLPFIQALQQAYPKWRVLRLVNDRDLAYKTPGAILVGDDVWEKWLRIRPLPDANGEPVLISVEVHPSQIPALLDADLAIYEPNVYRIYLV